METRHIFEILDQTKFDALSEKDLETINAHTAECANCQTAFRAARMSSAIIKQTANAPAPNAFFQAKTLKLWREKQISSPKFAFRRWWQASAAMVFAMLFIAIGLISLTIVAPLADSAKAHNAPSMYKLYSTDSIVLDQPKPQNLTNEQALEALDGSVLNANK